MAAPMGDKSKRPKVGVGVIVTSKHHPGCVLIGIRKGSAPGTGEYALPGGHLEFGEGWMECAVRETLEETGLQLKNVQYRTVLNALDLPTQYHYVELVMQGEVDCSHGQEPKNREPDKCDGWIWVDWKNMPSSDQLFCGLRILVEQGFNPFS